jgi:hypothetical protein
MDSAADPRLVIAAAGYRLGDGEPSRRCAGLLQKAGRISSASDESQGSRSRQLRKILQDSNGSHGVLLAMPLYCSHRGAGVPPFLFLGSTRSQRRAAHDVLRNPSPNSPLTTSTRRKLRSSRSSNLPRTFVWSSPSRGSRHREPSESTTSLRDCYRKRASHCQHVTQSRSQD